MAQLKTKIGEFVSVAKKYWKEPAKDEYVSYKEIATLGGAGFGVQWASLLASTITLDAGNLLVGASLGLQPTDLYIMLVVANLVGIPISFFRNWYMDNHHMKGGKFIPFIVRSSFPLFFLPTILVWLPLENMEYTAKAVIVWFFYMIIQFFLCLYNDGWYMFQQIITPNSVERIKVYSITQIIYSLAPSISNLVIPTIAGLTFGLNDIRTYRIIYPWFCLIGLILNVIMFKKVKERLVLPKRGLEYVRFFDAVREVAKNKYFWITSIASWIGFSEFAYSPVLGWSFIYAYDGKYQATLGLVNTIIGNAALWAMAAAPFIITKVGKRNMLIGCNILNVIMLLILYNCYENLVALVIFWFFNNFVLVFANIYMPNINADMKDYHQWKTGVRVDGLFGPLSIIGTVLGFFTGMVVPAIQEKMGLLKDYDVLYDDSMRGGLFDALIIVSIIGAILNVIPYLFYDLTETKHKGYICVLKIRAMFDDFGEGVLDNEQLVECVEIIHRAREIEGKEKIAVSKDKIKAAKALPHKTEEETSLRTKAIKEARKAFKADKLYNNDLISMKIVTDELDKFSTLRYIKMLERAKNTYSQGMICMYESADDEKREAKSLPKGTKEEKVIRSDAIALARSKKVASELLKKNPEGTLVKPDKETEDAISTRDAVTFKDRLKQRKDIKEYKKAVSVYNRIVSPYVTAKNLIIQAENYTHLTEIEELYNKVIAERQHIDAEV